MSKRETRAPAWLWVLFALYAAVMLWLLFVRQRLDTYPLVGSYADNLKSNPWPFQTVVMFLSRLFAAPSAYTWRNVIVNLVGNIVMFIPLGVFFPLLFSACRRFSRCIGTVALTVLAVEAVQFFSLLGSFDADDILLNTLGAAIGYAVLSNFGGLTSQKT